MPYEKTQDKLENFIAQALDNREIRDGANQVDLDESNLRERFLDPSLEEKAPRIWETAAREIEAYNQVENAYEDRLAELRGEQERMRRSYLRMPRWKLVAVLVAFSSIFVPSLYYLMQDFISITGLQVDATLKN